MAKNKGSKDQNERLHEDYPGQYIDGPDTGTDVVEPKRMSVTLSAGEGAARSRLTILAMRKADDSATVFVTTTNVATKKTARGMTRKFDSFDLAVAALKELVQDAQKKGWHKAERSGGFKARPDAFTTMPTPPSTPKGKK